MSMCMSIIIFTVKCYLHFSLYDNSDRCRTAFRIRVLYTLGTCIYTTIPHTRVRTHKSLHKLTYCKSVHLKAHITHDKLIARVANPCVCVLQ